MNEEFYKLALVRHYFSFTPQCIALELPFLAGQRRADAVLVMDDKVHAIEIKSDRDNLDNLLQQISDYTRVFDFVSIFLSKSHLENARKSLPLNVGLITLEDGEVAIKRKARQIKRLDKKALSLSLDRFSLLDLLNTYGVQYPNYIGIDELARRLRKLGTIQSLRGQFRKQIFRKYQDSFQTFQREVGLSIHLEDLLNLGIQRELR
ncbi:sce7726 family protein [Marinobacter adhaerens]|uniref:sce7726 family protein n=1 Tax=Marinobacter adhaerens TaxID=1033846 RepID=UPI001C5A1768|nr:sce7726 family protein [Marinobacter adhaerens]MBW3225445.1 sce7726 family protein [Marinobacter adhaerens]